MTSEWKKSILISVIIVLLFWGSIIREIVDKISLFRGILLFVIFLILIIILRPKIIYFKNNFLSFSKDIIVIIGIAFISTLIYCFTEAIYSKKIILFWLGWVKYFTQSSIDIVPTIWVALFLVLAPIILILLQIPWQHE